MIIVSQRSAACGASAASLARMRSAVLSKMKVRMQPAAAPQPKSLRGMILYHIISYHITSYHIISYHINSIVCHIILYQFNIM